MTREEQVRQASIEYTIKNIPMCIGGGVCEHCGMLYSIYRPGFVIYEPLGYWEDKTEDDWGKEVISDEEYKKNIFYMFHQFIKNK